MANYIEETNMQPNRFVDFTSRYNNSKVVYYVINGERKIAFETYNKPSYASLPSDRFMLITSYEQYRPDLVSLKVYGTTDYWWTILEANNISDIFDFKTGLTIRLPSSPF